MIKVGIIGLGAIAGKAYLPVISSRKLDVHLFTRNEARLSAVADQYRYINQHGSLDSLMNSGIKGAFVHTATSSHYEIVKQLLHNNIHVFVDKPITYNYSTTEELVNLAERKKLILMAGFNRRFAPAYRKLKELAEPNMIILQKNRKDLPGDVRTFVFDDFIHVIDTILYLLPSPVDRISVSCRKSGELLYHVVLQLEASGVTAIGIMNRDSGAVWERLEVMTPHVTGIATNITELTMRKDRNETTFAGNDWEPTLNKRGFDQMITDFLHSIESNSAPRFPAVEALYTHKLCEEVVERVNMLMV